MGRKRIRVCVTGAAGYLGSWLCNKLLCKGHIVHATLRNLEDASKVGLLKSLPNAQTNLVLFQANICKAQDFEPAIHGCEFVLHAAHPTAPETPTPKLRQDTNIWDATTEGVRSILGCCVRSGTVKRLIYAGTVTAASPVEEDGTGFKQVLDESCWTPLNLSFPYSNDFLQAYTCSKTQSEKEALSYYQKEWDGGMEVVSLVCGLVGGDTILPRLPESMAVMISPVTGKWLECLLFLQVLVGSVPLLRIEDACEAHIFCMEQSSLSGRFLCACSYPTAAEIRRHYKEHAGGGFSIAQEEFDGAGAESGIWCGSTKLTDLGFQYKFDMKMTLDGSLDCARKLGVFNAANDEPSQNPVVR